MTGKKFGKYFSILYLIWRGYNYLIENKLTKIISINKDELKEGVI